MGDILVLGKFPFVVLCFLYRHDSTGRLEAFIYWRSYFFCYEVQEKKSKQDL